MNTRWLLLVPVIVIEILWLVGHFRHVQESITVGKVSATLFVTYGDLKLHLRTSAYHSLRPSHHSNTVIYTDHVPLHDRFQFPKPTIKGSLTGSAIEFKKSPNSFELSCPIYLLWAVSGIAALAGLISFAFRHANLSKTLAQPGS